MLRLVLIAIVLAAGGMPSLRAGEPEGGNFKAAVEEEEAPWWSASLSTGWDSLYMYRGANVIPNDQNGYGSSIAWTSAGVTFNLTEEDFLFLGMWICAGLTNTDYKEFDFNAAYTHAFGDLAVTLGYGMFDVMSAPQAYRYSHSLTAGAAYGWKIGRVTLTPAINCAYTAGPLYGLGGYAPNASSYLEGRLSAVVPVYREVASLAPYAAVSTNFRYNVTSKTDPASPFGGANSVETGLALRVAVAKAITLAPYVAYSYQWNEIAGTRPGTFWSGGAVIFSF